MSSIITNLTIVGFSAVFLYVIVQILTFYGIGSDQYGSYIGFYMFLLLSVFVLPNANSTINYSND
jgi:hypothetical protein